MNILFVPSAIVFHHHSEATVEHSPLWKHLVSRSEKIYGWIRDSSLHRSSHQDGPFTLDPVQCPANQKLVETLDHYNQRLLAKPIEELIARTRRFTVGIYNSYWSSAGGGERHALDLAEIAKKADCEVYLISESQFSLEKLRNFYGDRLDGLKTLVSGEITESLTQRFDIFINSTFCSTLASRAEVSYYITSFPHRNVTPAFISSYVFLHNSPYTHRWALRFWGPHQYRLLLPVLSFSSVIKQEDSPSRAEKFAGYKEKLILSVGRFNYDGHCKNQHIIAKTFAALSQSDEISPQWQLVIAGSVDWYVHASVSHFKATQKILEACQARVIANATGEDLAQLYRSASVFLNAAGLGSDPVHAPERSEHFGIAAFEALLAGCRLVSYKYGGPAMMVEESSGGFVYGEHDELANALRKAIFACELEAGQERVNRIRENSNYCKTKIDESLLLAHSLLPSSHARP
ncbi:MAG: glycosyltransferase family 4 protein [Cyanobacteria bacterium K_Offshore_surface_m2_239]|nr:glycosyltransferase family 4 protein [Cyanobacteria bacterium K_Offshore_surface_m2_239]